HQCQATVHGELHTERLSREHAPSDQRQPSQGGEPDQLHEQSPWPRATQEGEGSQGEQAEPDEPVAPHDPSTSLPALRTSPLRAPPLSSLPATPRGKESGTVVP